MPIKIYAAGNEEGISVYRYVYIKSFGLNQLWSYFKFLTSLRNQIERTFKLGKPDKQISIFLDSGAFSAWSKKITIDIQEYIRFIKENKQHIDVYAVLDDISDPEKTLSNQQIMEDAGLNPLPCFHYGEDVKYLEHYLANYDYVALGGMVPIHNKNLTLWLDKLFSDFICDRKGLPKIKIHGFGMTAFRLLRRYPWYSTDSTSWIMNSRMGSIYVPPKKGNKFVYDCNPLVISISKKSPAAEKSGQHISNISPSIKAMIDDYLVLKGFTELELSEEYIKRDLINIEYFKDFELAQPKWPWAYKRSRLKSFL